MSKSNYKKNDSIALLSKMLEEANRALKEKGMETELGKCEWVDIDGNPRCNSPWSEFQCQQANGTFYPGERCDD